MITQNLIPPLRIGFGRSDITNCSNVSYGGYPIKDCDIRESAFAKIMAIESANGKIFIIGLDVCELPAHLYFQITKAISCRTEIFPSSLIILPTHCHSTISYSKIDTDLMASRILDAIEIAQLSETEISSVEIREGRLPTGSIINRRSLLPKSAGETCVMFNTDCVIDIENNRIDASGWLKREWTNLGGQSEDIECPKYLNSPVDNRSTLWTFISKSEKPVASLLLGNTHAVTVSQGRVGPIFSADFPRTAESEIETQTGAPCIFINGSFGDSRPLQTDYTFSERERIGKLYAQTALMAPCNSYPVDIVSAAFTNVLWPIRNDIPRSWAEMQSLLNHLKNCKTSDPSQKKKVLDLIYTNNWLIDDYEKLGGIYIRNNELSQGVLPVVLMTLKIGPIRIAGLPGEPFTRISNEIEEKSGFRVVGNCGMSRGYLPDPVSRESGGYESSLCMVDADFLKKIPSYFPIKQ